MFKESETLELKKSLSQLKEGIISLSSMLNKSHKGTLIFGINDEGRVVGLDLGQKTINDINHEIRNELSPLPYKIEVNEEYIEEKKVVVIEVEGDDTPYSAYLRYYIRMGDMDIAMSGEQLKKFFEEKEDTYLKWEEKDSGKTIEEVDENLVIECIRNANEIGRMSYVYRNLKEALSKLGLLTKEGNLNNAGYYLFSKKEPLKIKLASFPTDSRVDFGEIKEFNGNIFECMKEALFYIQNHISYKSTIVGVKRIETPEIPLKAIREIVINSFAHCSYFKVGDYNTYIIFKSSIRIYNPGNIINNCDPINFASGIIGSKIRNPLISSIFYKYGYIDAFGTGFERTFYLCNKENIKYHYYNDPYGFTFIFNRNKNFLSINNNDDNDDDYIDTTNNNDSDIKDIDIINKNIINKKENIYDSKLFLKPNKIDEDIINLIKENRFITIEEMSKKTNKSTITIYRHLENLNNSKKIIRIGSRKTGYWEIINEE